MAETLADRVKRLKEQTEADNRARRLDSKYSRTARMREDIATSGRFLYQVSQGFSVLNTWIFQPVLHFLIIKSKWLWKFYHRVWSFVVYRRVAEDGVLVFSKTRAAGMLFGSGLFIWFLLLPIVDCIYEASMYLITAKLDERVYLLGSQEIDSTSGSHIIEGCLHLPCSDQDAIYFRTENSLFNNLWSLSRGRGIFYPEYVGAAVPYATSKCVVTSYGFRFRLPFRIANTYSYMLAVTCIPVAAPHQD